jgi:FAD/FMN-containing dehydrogenase
MTTTIDIPHNGHARDAAELARSLHGRVILPGDTDYDAARAIWNSMHEVRPALLVQPADAADVALALRFAGRHGLPVAVRGGGHSVAGKGTVADGLVIDLVARMRGVSVDPAARVVRVQGGATLGDMDAATQAHGLAVPTGVVSMTGATGLTLGGGVGWLTRPYGLAADNLLAADLVLADGRQVRVDASTPELLWGLKGGGGNFGVVTQLEMRAYPLGPDVLAGAFIHHRPRWADALGAFERWATDLPDQMTAIVTFIRLPAAWDVSPDPVMVTGFAWAGGDRTAGHVHLDRLRELSSPDIEVLEPTTWIAWQSSMDELFSVGGQRAYWKNVALRHLGADAVAALVTLVERLPLASGLDIHHMGGAFGRVPVDATAFPNRSAAFWVNAYAIWTDPADDTAGIGWARDVQAGLATFAGSGEYVNFLGAHDTDEDESRAAALRAYGPDQLARLARLKRQVDPQNVFRRNHNIPIDLDI